MIIKIDTYSATLDKGSESLIIEHIKSMILSRIWTRETKIEAWENGNMLDSGNIEDFFNI